VLLSMRSSAGGGQIERFIASSAQMAVGELSLREVGALPRLFRAGGAPDAAARNEEAAEPGIERLIIDRDHWLSDRTPAPQDIIALDQILSRHLGFHGLRWLRACAVYPTVQWELTLALGNALSDHAGRELVTEARLSRLAELPWMRVGDMPNWLRAHLIAGIDDADRTAIHGTLTKIIDAAADKGALGPRRFSLRFGVGGGKSAFSDQQFVRFITRAPKNASPQALAATRQLRALLAAPLVARLFKPEVLVWLVVGLVWAFMAYLVAPRLSWHLLSFKDWAPLLALAAPPLTILILRHPTAALAQRVRGVARWRTSDISLRQILMSAAVLALTSIRLSGTAARIFRDDADYQIPFERLRRRVRFWAFAARLPWLAVGLLIAAIITGFAIFIAWSVAAVVTYGGGFDPFQAASAIASAFLQHLITDWIALPLTAMLAIAALGGCIVLFLRILARVTARRAELSADLAAGAMGEMQKRDGRSAFTLLAQTCLTFAATAYGLHAAFGMPWKGSLLAVCAVAALLHFWHHGAVKKFRIASQRLALGLDDVSGTPDILVAGPNGAVRRAIREFRRVGIKAWRPHSAQGDIKPSLNGCPLVLCTNSLQFPAWPPHRVIDGRAFRRRGGDFLPAIDHSLAMIEDLLPLRPYRQPTTPFWKFDHHRGAVKAACYSGDGDLILTADADGEVHIIGFGEKSGRRNLRLEREITSACFSPDGGTILVTARDGMASLMEVDGKELARWDNDGVAALSGAFAPDGLTLALAWADGRIDLIDTATFAITERMNRARAQAVSFSPDGQRLLVVAQKAAHIHALPDLTEILALPSYEKLTAACHTFDPDVIVLGDVKGQISIWNRETDSRIASFEAHDGAVLDLCCSADGRLASASQDMSAKIWDIETNVLLAELTGHRAPVVNCAFSPGGTLFLTASQDATARLWVNNNDSEFDDLDSQILILRDNFWRLGQALRRAFSNPRETDAGP